jgi:SAM-dependent methyltransferase
VNLLRRSAAPSVDAATAIGCALVALAAWEGGWYVRRAARRKEIFAQAQARARSLKRRLVVIGAPDGGVTGGYGCGDVTIDLAPTSCPNALTVDVTKRLPFADDSVVVFCSCVLEYVRDPQSAIREIWRVAGDNAFFVGVEPWTLTAYLYPGARQTLAPQFR